MAKVKNKKSNLADTYAQRRKKQASTKKTHSPFEVHINRDKQNVLGRKSKSDKGLPGIARTKAISKRKNTLLLEYKIKDKDNIFLDKRIGEKNAGMSQEDKAMARFAAERIKAHNKKNIFNLNDEEVLTHRGQTLIDIEKYDDPRSDDDDLSDNENKTGKLGKKFVEAHFGGGVLSKPGSETSRKDIIDQLISESKKRKAERQKVREETIDLTEKLDSEWRDLLPIVAASNKALEKVEQKSKADDFDITMRELKFAARGMATDKLKSEEVIAKEEKEKLEKLEQDRQARMKGFSDEAEFQNKHRSADDLDDFHIERIEENSDNEQELISILKKKRMPEDEEEDDNEQEKDGDESGDDEECDEDNDDDDNDDADNDGDESGEEDQKEESDDDLSDLKASESESEEETEQIKRLRQIKIVPANEKIISAKEKVLPEKEEIVPEKEELVPEKEELVPEKEKVKTKKTEIVFDKSVLIISDPVKPEEKKELVKLKVSEKTKKLVERPEVVVDTKDREAVMAKARQELPYTFKAPASYEELKTFFEDQNPDYQSVIVERIIKCNHWTLREEKNKEKLLHLYTYLLQYLDECASEVKSEEELVQFFHIFDRLCPHFYDLTHANPEGTKIHLRDVLKEKHDKFESNLKVYPGLEMLVLFKLVSILYPTSDFRHPIVTPCLVFMSQILLRCKIKRKQDISKGLFVCALVLEYTLLSKKWSPAVINYLRGVVYISLPKPFSKLIKPIPPFKTVGEMSNLLVLEDNHKKSNIEGAAMKMQIKDFSEVEMDDDYRIRTFFTAISLLCEFKELYSDLDVAFSIFEPIFNLLQCGSVKRYPKSVREKVNNLVGELEKLKVKKLEPLQFDKKKPKALRMYEPKIEVVHDGKRHRPMSKEKAEKEKLLHKLKKETKSAIREIRRDTSFIAKVKIKQQIVSDVERKRKVKEIFGDAAMQQHELKKFKKK